ncbi:hypothetical protein BDW68DRAFT_41426 [Aspergillus falconensis]
MEFLRLHHRLLTFVAVSMFHAGDLLTQASKELPEDKLPCISSLLCSFPWHYCRLVADLEPFLIDRTAMLFPSFIHPSLIGSLGSSGTTKLPPEITPPTVQGV